MAPTDLGELGRFSDPSLLVLCSLADGPKHGYAIARDVRAFAGVMLGSSTLHDTLERLQRLGLVERLPDEARRRPFRLSTLGARALQAQLAGLQRVVTTGRRRLRDGDAAPDGPPRSC